MRGFCGDSSATYPSTTPSTGKVFGGKPSRSIIACGSRRIPPMGTTPRPEARAAAMIVAIDSGVADRGHNPFKTALKDLFAPGVLDAQTRLIEIYDYRDEHRCLRNTRRATGSG